MISAPVGCGVGRVQAIDIGQQDQCVCHDELRDAGSEAVVVPVADLFRCDRIVLIDNGNDTAIDQAPESAARVQEATPILCVFGREQDLRRRYAVCRERLALGVGQLHLPCGRGGLEILEFRAAFVNSENRAANCDRTGGHDEHLVVAAMQARNILAEATQPRAVYVPISTNKQGRTNLDDETPVIVDPEGSH